MDACFIHYDLVVALIPILEKYHVLVIYPTIPQSVELGIYTGM